MTEKVTVRTEQTSLVATIINTLLALYALFLTVYLVLRFVPVVDHNALNFLHTFALYLFFVPLVGAVIALFTRNRQLVLVQFLLVMIGVLWLGGRQVRPMLVDTLVADDVLSVLTFNVFPDNEQLDTALQTILEYNADIVLLQEARGDITPMLDAYEYSYLQVMDAGCEHGIFSRFPLKDSGLVDLAGMKNQRAEVLLPDDTNIALYNLHLYMPLNENEDQFLLLRYDETRRNQQIQELLDLVASETIPVIVGGDFNMSEYSLIYNDLNAVMRDAYRETNYTFGFTFPAGAFEELGDYLPPILRLDYLWTSDDLTPIRAALGTPLGSDHLPLIAEIALPKQLEVAAK